MYSGLSGEDLIAAKKARAKVVKAEWDKKNRARILFYREENRARDRQREAEYRANNKDKIIEQRKIYDENNAERIKAYKVRYYEDNKVREKQRAKAHYQANKGRQTALCLAWVKNNPEKRKEIAARYKEKVGSTTIGRLKQRISARIRSSITSKGFAKNGRTQEILGCGWEDFKQHIERQFLKGMSWDIFGAKIHIDHIVPIASAKTEEDVLALSRFTNLRPMWAMDNIVKSDRITHLI